MRKSIGRQHGGDMRRASEKGWRFRAGIPSRALRAFIGAKRYRSPLPAYWAVANVRGLASARKTMRMVALIADSDSWLAFPKGMIVPE